MKTVVVVGAGGFVGKRLVGMMRQAYHVRAVDVRFNSEEYPDVQYITCDCMIGIPPKLIEGAHAIINLAGATIARRWTDSYKEMIYNSRITTTENIVDAISQCSNPPTVLVSASAIGIYGISPNHVCTEDSEKADDFLAYVCSDWEHTAMQASVYIPRVVILRTATVLSSHGGYISQLVSHAFAKCIGFFGTGDEHVPWVSLNDICRQYMYAIEHEQMNGVYNTASPTVMSMKQILKAIQKKYRIWFRIPVPHWVGKLMFSDFSQYLVTDLLVDSNKIQREGFVFEHTSIQQSLE